MHTLKQATISSSCSKWCMQSQLPMCKMGKFWLNLLGIKRILRLDENLVTGPNDLRDQMGLSISLILFLAGNHLAHLGVHLVTETSLSYKAA